MQRVQEICRRLFNSFIGPFFENLNQDQLNLGFASGNLVIKNLSVKKSLLDRFDIPIACSEGYIGRLSVQLSWLSLGRTPIRITVEDVILIAAPSTNTNYNSDEEEERAQALKQERLERSEALNFAQDDTPAGSSWGSYFNIQKIMLGFMNNIQLSVHNVHIRYEDRRTVPSHPFAVGVTLASLSVVSTDANWKPYMIEGGATTLHKLAELDSFALYFDTDCDSLSGLSIEDTIEKSRPHISSADRTADHQYILKPVNGQGKGIWNKNWLRQDLPQFDVELPFEKIAFALDSHQYRDLISMADVYHIYARQHQYRKYRPEESEFASNRPRALLKFAGNAILSQVHDKKRRETWAFLKERRDDRIRYLDLFKLKLLETWNSSEKKEFGDLEKKLAYGDIRFYRSILRNRVRKDREVMQKLEEKRKAKQRQQSGGWTGWLWGSGNKATGSAEDDTVSITDEERKELFELFDYDEKEEIAQSFEASKDSVKLRVSAQLKQGSMALRHSPHDGGKDVLSLFFDGFQGGFEQRPDNFGVSLSLGNFRVFDDTTTNTLYRQIVHVKETAGEDDKSISSSHDYFSGMPYEPFLTIKFEQNPLDRRADTSLSVYLRSMEVIYHKGYVEAVYFFFKPPESQLQSVEALLSAAGQTLEGLQKETRAGLEFALESHKTIDLHMDIHAPIIIIPESIVVEHCNHLVIDAGQVLVNSDLVGKDVLLEIEQKRKQKYTDDDYKRLESLMYDNFTVQLKSAQFVMGHNLEACRSAMKADTIDRKLHLLERINIDFTARNSIVPSARSLPRMKVYGKLPSLHVNFSDSKYKTLIRLLDVIIPHFDDDTGTSVPKPQRKPMPTIFDVPRLDDGIEYESDEETTVGEEDRQMTKSENDLAAIKQHIFEFAFQVDSLQVTLLRSGEDDFEKPLGVVHLNSFSLTFSSAKFDMKVGVRLRSISASIFRSNADALELVSTEAKADTKDSEGDLMTVKYTRVQRASPDYFSVYGGTDQSVDVVLSTFVFQADPEPVLDVYDFIMTTFVPNQQDTPKQATIVAEDQPVVPETQGQEQKICVRVRLASFEVLLKNGSSQLATLALSTANVSVDLQNNTMRVTARLGDAVLTDDSSLQTKVPAFKRLLSIEGDEVAEFRYETYDTKDSDPLTSINSSVFLKAGALKFHFIEEPLHDLYIFLLKFAKLKSFYDSARMVAVQKASEIERMGFEISISSPIVIFPNQPQGSEDKFTTRLGEIVAKNRFNGNAQFIHATLSGIQLTSTVSYPERPSLLKIVDDVTISSELTLSKEIDRERTLEAPDTQAAVSISDVKLHLTQLQYCRLLALLHIIPRVFATDDEDVDSASHLTPPSGRQENDRSQPTEVQAINLQPELDLTTVSVANKIWTTLDVVINLNVAKLHLYQSEAKYEEDLKDRGIARFALNKGSLNLKILSDNAIEAELAVKSFTMSNTIAGPNKHREIIPAANHDRNQLMVLFTNSGGTDASSVAIVTVDSPHVIFSIEPVFALSEFFLSAFQSSDLDDTPPAPEPDNNVATTNQSTTPSSLSLRFDLHDASICILENDSQTDCQAVRFSVKQLSLSHQRIVALTIGRLGMSLIRMGKQSDSVRVLDEVDLTLSLSLDDKASRQYTNIQLDVQPIVLRTSYRDIMLMMSIVNKALERFSQGSTKGDKKQIRASNDFTSKRSLPSRKVSGLSRTSGPSRIQQREASVIVSTEKLVANFDSFRFVLIGDLHESPMLHLQTKALIFAASDWSSQLQASTTISTSITYWNLKNSHWEPFIDPWTFSLILGKVSNNSAMSISLKSNEHLDMNISSSFVELAISTAKIFATERESMLQKARGSYPPYRICNKTGGAISVWSDVDGSRPSSEYPAVKVLQGGTIDWRFDDWKSMRETVSSSGHNSIGIQFDGKPWEQLRSVPVDREGEYAYSLRPRTDKVTNKLMCDISIKDNVKIVTLRSTYNVANRTLYPLELTLVDTSGHPVYSVEKIAPGETYALPIEAVTQTRVRLQPDQGFGYRWSSPIRWDDAVNIGKGGRTIRCPHMSQNEAPFRFHVWPVMKEMDKGKERERRQILYPQLTLNLRAPIELENLLPYNIQYKIYDRDSDQNWSSYLRKGGIMPVHSVELGHLVLLSVTVQDSAFKASEFAIINADNKSDFGIEHHLSLSDSKDRKLELKLNYVRHPDSGGAFKVQIYSPYILVNKTGLPFAIKSVHSRTRAAKAIAGEDVAGETSKRIPFMVSHQQRKGNDFIFRVGESAWSQSIGLEAPSAESMLILPSTTSRSELQVGLSWSEGLGKYKLTKVITLAPRFFICNNLDRPVQFRERAVAPDRPELQPGERCPLLALRGDERQLTLAYPGLDAQWCPSFRMEDIGIVHLRMREPASLRRQDDHLIAINISIERATIFIKICPHEGHWPFIIENNSTFEVSFGQVDTTHERPEENMLYKISPNSKLSYAWDFPSANEKKIYLIGGGRARRLDIMEIGVLPPLKMQQNSGALSLDVRADGQSQILSITNYREEESLYKLTRRDTGTMSRRDSIATTSGVDFEAVEEESPLSLIVKLQLKGLGISLMNKKLVEVVYLSSKDLEVVYTNSAAAQSLNLSCGMLQVDNQLHNAQFPVVLQPTPLTRDLQKVAALPTVQASLILVNDDTHGVLFVKYASILLQAITIQIDEPFLFAVLDLTKVEGVDWEAESENVLIEHPDDVPEPVGNKSGQSVYFEVLELQPIILSVSFVKNDANENERDEPKTQKVGGTNPFAVALNVLTMTVGNLGDARLEFNALGLKDARLALPDLQDRIIYHYRQEVLRQLYRILGSADFLGNPVGLFTNVSSGVADIFYEPWRGVVQHGGSELGIGIAKGAASFMKKTIFGFSDSFTRVTRSFGKGLSAATLDSEYQSKRRQSQRKNKPRHAFNGVTAGAEAFANSVASGVEGVLMKPIEGAEAEGAVGFFKGMGKGLVGAVTKPVVGVFDLASNVSEGIRNTTTVFDAPQRDRVRKPRHVPADGVLQPYSTRAATGQYWLRDLDPNTQGSEYYMTHLDIPGGDTVVMLTSNRVLSFGSRNLRMMWDMPFDSIQGVTVESTGIRFSSKRGKGYDRFVSIQSQPSIHWFFNEVAAVVKTYNAKRRLER